MDRLRYKCQFPGCNKSYIRSEHLNRHALSHRKGNFVCYLCQRRFTRNDLLNAHLRRHEKRRQSSGGAALEEGPSSSLNESSLSAPSPQQAGSPADVNSSDTRSSGVSTIRPEYPQVPPIGPLIQESNRTIGTSGSSLRAPPPFLIPDTNAASHPLVAESPTDGPRSELSTSPGGGLSLQNAAPFFPSVEAEDDQAWLFHPASVFDLPSEDYLNLHFGGALGPTSPPDFYHQDLQPPAPPFVIPRFTSDDHQRLLSECPDLLSTPLREFTQLSRVLFWTLDYCDVYLPLFHRPTLDISSCSTSLCLAMCCLGTFLGSDSNLHDAGKLLYKHIWRSTVEKALLSPRVEMGFLQTLILIEHICTYTMSRHEHEMAEIVHGIVVTLASRNNLMTESCRSEGGSRQSLDTKWREWAQRESVIRIAHTIFVNDVQYMVYFTHHAALSVGMMKLPLPSHPSLWDAKTAADWETQMRQMKKSARSKYFSLSSAMESVMSIRESDHKRELLQRQVMSNPLSLHFLIHGIASAIGDAKYRSVFSASTPASQVLKTADFDEALSFWKACFDRLSEPERTSQLAWCSQVMYFFSTILLRNSLADIQMAAGSAFSSGRAVTPQGAQAAYTRLTKTNPVSHDSYLRGLGVVSLCLQGDGSGSGSLATGIANTTPTSQSPPPSPPHPLWQTYGAFLGILVLWAHTIGLERPGGDTGETEKLLRSFNASSAISTASPILANMVDEELSRSRSFENDVRAIKGNVRRLVMTVHDMLTQRPWEISHEAARILNSLIERDNSRIQ